jgi:hypothetical protein
MIEKIMTKNIPSKSFEGMGMSNICKQWYRGLRNEV